MNKQLELCVLQGLPASGKSTYALKWVNESPKTRIRVNRDDIRRMLGPYWVPQRESLVTDIENDNILLGLLDGYDVVVDSTNLRGTQRFIDLLNRNTIWNVEITIQSFLDVPVDVCIERDKNREYSVGGDVIDRMATKYNIL